MQCATAVGAFLLQLKKGFVAETEREGKRNRGEKKGEIFFSFLGVCKIRIASNEKECKTCVFKKWATSLCCCC